MGASAETRAFLQVRRCERLACSVTSSSSASASPLRQPGSQLALDAGKRLGVAPGRASARARPGGTIWRLVEDDSRSDIIDGTITLSFAGLLEGQHPDGAVTRLKHRGRVRPSVPRPRAERAEASAWGPVERRQADAKTPPGCGFPGGKSCAVRERPLREDRPAPNGQACRSPDVAGWRGRRPIHCRATL